MEITESPFFDENIVRQTRIDNKRWFCISDIIRHISDSESPKSFWQMLKNKLISVEGYKLSRDCRILKISNNDSKEQEIECINLKGLFRLLQSAPSKKAEPYKRWIAKVANEHLDEVDNPSLILDRAYKNYDKLVKAGKDVAPLYKHETGLEAVLATLEETVNEYVTETLKTIQGASLQTMREQGLKN